MAERPTDDQLRRRLRTFWATVLDHLDAERQAADAEGRNLSESFVKKAAKACDQIRRDYDTSPARDASTPDTASTPATPTRPRIPSDLSDLSLN